jgi:hypothetical protein
MMGRNATLRGLRRLLQALVIVLLLPTLIVSADSGAIQLGKTELASRGYPNDEGKEYGLGANGNSVYTSLSWFENVTNYAKLAFASAAENLRKDDLSGNVIPDTDTVCQSEVSSVNRGCYDVFVQNPAALEQHSIGNPVFITGFDTDVEGDALFPTLSRDGRYLVFQSGAEYTNFDNAANLETDIFLAILPQDHDPTNSPPLFRVSAEQSTGADAGFHSGNVDCDPVTYGVNHTTPPACRTHPNTGTAKPNFAHPHPVADAVLTDTGVYVAFESMADLGENSNGYVKDIFVRQVNTIESGEPSQEFAHTLLSIGCNYTTGQNDILEPANGDSYHPVFVPNTNGRYVVFVSRATNLDCSVNPADYPADDPYAPLHRRRANIFLADRDDGSIHLITKGQDGKPANGASEYPAVTVYQDTADPNPKLYIAFQSSASNLVTGDTNGYTDIFLYIADDILNPTSGQFRPISRATGESSNYGEQANAPSYSPAISGDGKLVTFTSYATNLVVGDDNESCPLMPPGIEGWVSSNCPDIFARRWGANQTWRVSLTTVGEQAQWNSNFSSLSLSGRYVAFSSGADMLSQGEGVPYQQVYLRDQGNPPGNPNIQPTAYNFGVVPFGQTVTKEFRVNYLDSVNTLKYIGLAITEGEYKLPDNPYGFSIVSNTCVENQEYGADEFCTFTIQFTAPNFSTREVQGKAKYTVSGRDPLDPGGEAKERFVLIGLVGATPFYEVNIPDDPEPVTLPNGATRTEVLKVYNTGNYTDSFDISLNYVSGCSFTHSVTPSQLSNIPSGGYGEVTVQVTVTRPDCKDEQANKIRLRATSRGDAGKYSDRVIETSSYSYQPAIVQVNPDPETSVMNMNWSEAKSFTFTVRNDGETADSFSVSFANNEFSLWLDPADAPRLNNIAAGEEVSVKIWVRATQPNHADHDIRVIFTSQGDPSKKDERTLRVTSGPAYIYLPLVRK